jgi:hypothetical protein
LFAEEWQVWFGFLNIPYLEQHNEDRTLINPIMPLNTLSFGLLRAYEQSFAPVIVDVQVNAKKGKET